MDKTYLNLNYLNFLSELSKFAIELKLDDLHQIGYLMGITLQSLPPRTLEAATAGKIDGLLLITRINNIIDKITSKHPYVLTPLVPWDENKPLDMIGYLAEAYADLESDNAIYGQGLEERIRKLIDYLGPFVFAMFLIDGLRIQFNSRTSKYDFFFSNFLSVDLNERMKSIGISRGVRPSSSIVILTKLITYTKILGVPVENGLEDYKNQIMDIFSFYRERYRGITDKSELPTAVYTACLIDILSRIQREIYSWIDDNFKNRIENLYLKRLFKDFPRTPTTTNLLYEIMMRLSSQIPSIQSRSLEEDASGRVELLELVNPFNTKEILKIKISADLIYDLNLVELISRFPEDDTAIGKQRIKIRKDVTIAIRHFYDDFFIKFVPFLRELTYGLDGVSYEDYSCDEGILYFDVCKLAAGKIVTLQTGDYKRKGQTYYKLDFSDTGSPEFRESMLVLYRAFMEHRFIQVFGFELTGEKVSPENTLFIFDQTGVIYSGREGMGDSYTNDGQVSDQFLQNVADEFNNLINSFMSQSGIPTAISSMKKMFALNRLSFMKKLLRFDKEENRVKYFSQNIDKGFCKKFHKVSPLWGIDIDTWNEWHDWYDEYIYKNKKIDEEAIVWFLSIMIDEDKDVIRKWFKDTEEYDFENMRIKMEPWFKPEFLVLHKYFPNVQYVN